LNASPELLRRGVVGDGDVQGIAGLHMQRGFLDAGVRHKAMQ